MIDVSIYPGPVSDAPKTIQIFLPTPRRYIRSIVLTLKDDMTTDELVLALLRAASDLLKGQQHA